MKVDSPIKALSELAGKKVGVFPGSTSMTLLKKYLTDQGVDVSGITFVPVPAPNQLAALLEGSIAAVHAYEPTIAIGLSKGTVRKLHDSVYADMLDPNPQGVAIVSAKFIKEHPETAKKVIRALERGMVFMQIERASCRERV